MKHFHYFLDEEVDGMTLQHLATVGTSENLRQCGITKLRDELKFRRLVQDNCKVAAITTHLPITAARTDRKFTKLEMTQLSPEDKQAYLIKWVQLSIWALEMVYQHALVLECFVGL